jgi:hypothetical protein
LNKFLNAVNFGAVKSLVTLKTNRLKPEFSDLSISFNMDVRWLMAIACVAKESIWANGQQRGHSKVLL